MRRQTCIRCSAVNERAVTYRTESPRRKRAGLKRHDGIAPPHEREYAPTPVRSFPRRRG